MMLTRRQAGLGLVAAAGAALAMPRMAAAQGRLVVPTYGGLWAQFWESTLMPGFTAATGIDPILDVGLGRDFVARVRAGGGSAPYSIFMGNENIAAILRAEGFFEPFDMAQLPNAANVFPQLVNPGNMGIRAIVSPIGLAYRTDMVETPPTSWTDLWENPEFRGRTGLYQIGNTGAVLLLRLVGEIYGSGPDDFDTAFARLKELLPFTQASWSGEAAAALIRGDVIVAPVDWTEIMILQDRGAPVDIVVPEEGVLAFEQSFNLVAAGDAKEAAHAYLNYLLDPEVQSDMASAFYTSPSNSLSTVEGDLAERLPIVGERMAEIRSFDWDSYVDVAADIADRWNREMG